MKKVLSLLAVTLGLCVAASVQAANTSTEDDFLALPHVDSAPGTEALRKEVKQYVPLSNMVILKTDVDGMYEVSGDQGAFFVDKDARFMVMGDIVDLKNKAAYSPGHFIGKATALDFKQFPLDLAIKRVHGKGSKKLIVFEDPFCGYCHKLDTDLAKLNDVTIYTFVLPFLREESSEYAKRIWCSTNPAKAWEDMTISRIKPAELKGDCDFPQEKLFKLAERMRVTSTPVMFFPDNSKVNGYVPLDVIKKHWQ